MSESIWIASFLLSASVTALGMALLQHRSSLRQVWQYAAKKVWLRLPRGLASAIERPFLLAGRRPAQIESWWLKNLTLLTLLVLSLLLSRLWFVHIFVATTLVWCFSPLLLAGRQARKRQQHAVYALPVVMDALALLLATGSPLMTALQKSVVRRTDPLCEELRVVLNQIRTGESFNTALTHLSDRLPRAEIRAFTSLLLQASVQGNSLVSLLEQQAEVRREITAAAIEQQAQETPVRMLGPLALFIFPATILPFIGVIAAKLMWQV